MWLSPYAVPLLLLRFSTTLSKARMTQTAELQIKPFLEHYAALQEHRKLEDALQALVTTLHPDNRAYLIRNPFQELVEQKLQEFEPELWEWYTWWMCDADHGNAGLEFWIDDVPYNTADYGLEDFLRIVLGEDLE